MNTRPEYTEIYEPKELSKIKGCVQIVHGMSEHQGRYKGLCEFLSQHGYAVMTSDLRGHGQNTERPEALGYFGDNGAAHLVGDVHEITNYLKAAYPDAPCFLVGHSMGSLISVNYLKRYDNFLDGVFLSGMPSNRAGIGLMRLLLKIEERKHGEYYRPALINNMVVGSYARRFKKEGSKNAWLSKNREVWEAFENDPKCNFVFTVNGFMTLGDLLEGVYKKGSWIMKRPALPITLMSGSKDPVTGGKRRLASICTMLERHGYTNVKYICYQNERHEIFNDTEHLTAWNDLLGGLDEISSGTRAE